MFINTFKTTTPEEPYYSVLYIEQNEEVIGCVMNTQYTCQKCKLRLMCRIKIKESLS